MERNNGRGIGRGRSSKADDCTDPTTRHPISDTLTLTLIIKPNNPNPNPKNPNTNTNPNPKPQP